MSQLSDIYDRHAKYQDSLVSAFTEHLHDILIHAQASVTGELQRKLAIIDGMIDNTPGNARIVRGVGKALQKAMDRYGYQRLVNAFVGEFPGQLQFLQEIVDWIGQQTKVPFPPMKFTSSDLNVLTAMSSNAATTLAGVMDTAATTAMSRGLFSVGGLAFADLVETIADKLQASIPQATTVADTSMSVFLRTATEQRYDAMQKDLPGIDMRYKYSGPDDKVTRPFCHRMLAKTRKEGLTRAEIDGLDNMQLPNTFVTCGGYLCRHAWLLDTNFAMKEFKKAA